ncbi:MAG: ABC transporter permease [Anaerolineales bacterium]|nr:ABC transporter permease [Anaerolineales bacterium]MBP6210376.1 ABC transporter permease [Anaerolineales bacterium]
MLFSENIKIALRALRANKMRSGLTILGIVIGVATVVALLSIGNGATASITDSIQSGGSNLLTVSPGKMQTPMTAAMGSTQQASYLYYSDYEVLDRTLTGDISSLVAVYQANYTVKFGDESFTSSVSGVMADHAQARSFTLAEGRFISDGDNKSLSKVVVIGSTVAKDLFGTLPPVGQIISINGVKFEVVGVLQEEGAIMASPDDVIYVPLETGYSRLFGDTANKDGKKTVNSIMISVVNAEDMDAVSAQTEYILRRAHELKPTEETDFNILDQADTLETLNTVTQTLTIFLGAIAAISLLVGGIGIMNIMLVSVTERTKEIGLRKAVGATKNQILTQFLIETVTLSLLGGIVGILLGVGIALGFSVSGLINSVITSDSILMAFFFALAIGIFFGLYPAFRAASLHPMVALRYE